MKLEERIASLLGTRVSRLRPIRGRGYSVAIRNVAELDDGRAAFVKLGSARSRSSPTAVRSRL